MHALDFSGTSWQQGGMMAGNCGASVNSSSYHCSTPAQALQMQLQEVAGQPQEGPAGACWQLQAGWIPADLPPPCASC